MTGGKWPGHGTRVAKVLDLVLPPRVGLVAAKIADTDEGVTLLALIRAFADLVSAYKPSVVNLSLSARDDQFNCGCGQRAITPTFISTLLPFVIQLAGDVVTVMAAGNSGEICHPPHASADASNLIYAVSVNSQMHRTRYSSYPALPEMAVSAFGGDDPEDERGFGVFDDDRKSVGTSFAAPFVSAAICGRMPPAGNAAGVNRPAIPGPFCRLMGNGWIPGPVSML